MSSAPAEKKKKKPRSHSKLAEVSATADDVVENDTSNDDKQEAEKTTKKTKRRSKQVNTSKLGLSLDKVGKEKEENSEEPSLGLFSPRAAEQAQESGEEKVLVDALFSPRPHSGVLDPKEKLTNKEKRNSIRKEIRRSIRLSRGLNPEDINLDQPIDEEAGDSKMTGAPSAAESGDEKSNCTVQ